MPEYPDVAIIVLNWNNPGDTLACLNSIFELSYPAVQVIVVDNGSSDDSVTRIREAYPDIKIIDTGTNLGYTGGNNVGINQALNQGADFIWLLNDDVLVAPDSLTRLIEATAQYPDGGFWGPMIRMRENPQKILSAGGFLNESSLPEIQGLGEVDSGQYAQIIDVDYLSGCALLVKGIIVKEIGLLDEKFFSYHEDVEWCYRGKQAGYQVLLVPDAIVWHPDTTTRDVSSARVTYYISRNHLLFLSKHRLGTGNMVKTFARYTRWLLNWSLNPKWRAIRPKRDALWWAIRDFSLMQYGKRNDLP